MWPTDIEFRLHRSYSPLLGRLLHDRTADKIAGVVSRVPNAGATLGLNVEALMQQSEETEPGSGIYVITRRGETERVSEEVRA